MQKELYTSDQIRAEIGLDLNLGRNQKNMILSLYPSIYIVAMGFWLRITFHVVFKYAGPKKIKFGRSLGLAWGPWPELALP